MYFASGALDLPFTLSFTPKLVHACIRATIGQLVARGYRAVVVLTGHGPLDLNHMIKRACAEAEAEHRGLAAYGLCWIELNAARLTAPETGEPDDGRPRRAHRDLVDARARAGPRAARRARGRPGGEPPRRLRPQPALHRLASSSAARRSTLRREPARRARARAARGRAPRHLRRPAHLHRVRLARAAARCAARRRPRRRSCCTTRARSSRYISSLDLAIDGKPVGREQSSWSTTARARPACRCARASSRPSAGSTSAANQDATIALGDLPVTPGPHDVSLEIGLGGVTSLLLEEQVEFHEHGGER